MRRFFSPYLLKQFLQDNCGATAVVMSLSFVPVVTTLGISVDMARAHAVKTNLQNAVDSAALAAAIAYRAGGNTAIATAAANNTFAAAKGKIAATLATPVIDASTGKVSLSASATQTNHFIALLSPANLTATVGAKAEVKSPLASAAGLGMNLEVSLMLDVTVSMSQNSGTSGLSKLAAMQQAARELIDTVVQTTQSPHKSRVALVPFSSAVNVSARFISINGSSPSPSSWTSVVERGGAYAFTEDAPGAVSYFPSFVTAQVLS